MLSSDEDPRYSVPLVTVGEFNRMSPEQQSVQLGRGDITIAIQPHTFQQQKTQTGNSTHGLNGQDLKFILLVLESSHH